MERLHSISPDGIDLPGGLNLHHKIASVGQFHASSLQVHLVGLEGRTPHAHFSAQVYPWEVGYSMSLARQVPAASS